MTTLTDTNPPLWAQNDAARIYDRASYEYSGQLARASEEVQERLRLRVRAHRDFRLVGREDHDWGEVYLDGEKVFWSIEYYGSDGHFADDPRDPATRRLILLTHERDL